MPLSDRQETLLVKIRKIVGCKDFVMLDSSLQLAFVNLYAYLLKKKTAPSNGHDAEVTPHAENSHASGYTNDQAQNENEQDQRATDSRKNESE